MRAGSHVTVNRKSRDTVVTCACVEVFSGILLWHLMINDCGGRGQ